MQNEATYPLENFNKSRNWSIDPRTANNSDVSFSLTEDTERLLRKENFNNLKNSEKNEESTVNNERRSDYQNTETENECSRFSHEFQFDCSFDVKNKKKRKNFTSMIEVKSKPPVASNSKYSMKKAKSQCQANFKNSLRSSQYFSKLKRKRRRKQKSTFTKTKTPFLMTECPSLKSLGFNTKDLFKESNFNQDALDYSKNVLEVMKSAKETVRGLRRANTSRLLPKFEVAFERANLFKKKIQREYNINIGTNGFSRKNRHTSRNDSHYESKKSLY